MRQHMWLPAGIISSSHIQTQTPLVFVGHQRWTAQAHSRQAPGTLSPCRAHQQLPHPDPDPPGAAVQ